MAPTLRSLLRPHRTAPTREREVSTPVRRRLSERRRHVDAARLGRARRRERVGPVRRSQPPAVPTRRRRHQPLPGCRRALNPRRALIATHASCARRRARTWSIAPPNRGEESMYGKIVVGTDGSAGAQIAVGAAIELARLTGATLHVVHGHKLSSAYHLAAAFEVGVLPHVVESDEAILAESHRICDEAVAQAARVGVATEAHYVAGDAADALIKVATDAEADLIVVGNRGMAGARRFVLGSVPNKVSHHCPSSLLIVDTSHAGA